MDNEDCSKLNILYEGWIVGQENQGCNECGTDPELFCLKSR